MKYLSDRHMKYIKSHFNQIWQCWSWGSCTHFFGLLLFAIIVYGPLFALVVEAGRYLFTESANLFYLVMPEGRRLLLLINSIILALSVAASGMILGILAGSVLWRWRTGYGAYARWFLLSLVAVPPYVHALAWSSIVSTISIILQGIGLPGISLQGWIGSWWVQLMSLLPIAVGLTLVGFESVEMIMIEAARFLRSDMHVLLKVVLPLAAPAILVGAGFLFLFSIVDYSVPSLFSVNVYSLEIFSEYSTTNQPATAFLLSLPLLLVTMVVVVISQAPLRNTAQNLAWRNRAWVTAPVFPAWFIWLQRFSVALLVLQIAVLILVLIATVGSWENMISNVTLSISEISLTFWIALATSIICLPIALAVARELERNNKGGQLIWLLVTLPLAIPAPLVGIGLISIWNQPFMSNLYGTSIMPVLATLARFTSLATLIILAQLRYIDPLLIDASRVFNISTLRTWLQIRLPLLAPGLLAAAGIAFALSIGELGATLIVAPPGQTTLTIRTYNYLHYGASSAVAGLCLVIVISTLVAGFLAMIIMAGWLHPPPDEQTSFKEGA